MNITNPIEKLPYVGPTYAKRLKKLQINTIEDLIFHFPFRYDDFSLITPIDRIHPGETVTIVATIEEIKNEYTKGGRKIQKAVAVDKSGKIDILWFNQPFLVRIIKVGETYNFSGKVDWFGRKLAMVSPDYETIKKQESLLRPAEPDYGGQARSKNQAEGCLHTGRLVPVYNETYGISSKWLRTRINSAFGLVGNDIKEFLPKEIIEKEDLLSEIEAITQIHFPDNPNIELLSRRRLAFDELFLIQLSALLRKREWTKQAKGISFNIYQEKVDEFIKNLPFKLTSAQERCTNEILSDLKKESPMNRLMVGDVGSGKTVVAAIAAFVTSLNGLKTMFMAPTQILANQHFETLKKMFEPLGIEIEIITSETPKKTKQDSKITNYQDKKTNSKIIVGTHALLYRDIENVGLIIIDEQHRFGVEQRALLSKKQIIPHVLTMTATPIPRTIVLTLYNDLDLSVIDELPPGKAITKTWVVPNNKRSDAYEWIRKKVKGTVEQSFIICPLVDESDNLVSVRAATKEFETLSNKIFPDLKLGLLHGRIKSEEKRRILEDFTVGRIDILVSTPVVEVGIDIPNATIMLIEAADRFGLAQLHQLRGRIGRRSTESYCLLFSENESLETRARIKSLEKTSLGVELAEIDLKLRGPGEIYGKKQHGFFGLKIASYSDLDLIKKTRSSAEFVLQNPLLINDNSLQSRLEKYKIENVINN